MNGTNAYYFMTDGTPSDVRGLRVLRACDISTCSTNSSLCSFEALYELRIDCGGTLPFNSVICGLSVLDSFADSSDTTVVLARCNRGTRNRVCSFRLADIDREMDRKYSECAWGTGDIWVAWDFSGSSGRRSCAGFRVITIQSYNSVYCDVLFVVHCVYIYSHVGVFIT